MTLYSGTNTGSRYRWECPDCGNLNEADDASCECERHAERRELTRRLILSRIECLSPRERRERFERYYGMAS
jgi:hypothetical protein